jgi:LmbE family N-acetylglucosaminyl deacetylase
MPKTLVTFHAHPDDESLLTAGVMAQAAAAGHRVVLVVATSGEVGEAAASFRGDDHDDHDALGATRRRELARSAEILGVARVELLGYRDSGHPRGDEVDAFTPAPGTFAAADPSEAADRLAEILREEQADVLTTYDPNGGYGHPDHLRVHEVGARRRAGWHPGGARGHHQPHS